MFCSMMNIMLMFLIMNPDGWESASDEDDDDDDGEWVDVRHSSDEDTGEVVRVLRFGTFSSGCHAALS